MKIVVTFEENIDTPIELVLTKKLGFGKFEVYHAKSLFNGAEYAVKVFPDNAASRARYTREKDILALLNHQNILKHHVVIEHDATFDILVMDYVPNGDFFDIVSQGGLAHEVHMRSYFHQLIAGVEAMHGVGIAHLDLKLENIMLGEDFLLKIIDFDQSQIESEKRLTAAGTNCYRAPEVLERNCRDIFAADVFSMGVVLFAFKTGQFPFVEVEQEAEAKMIYYDLFMENNEEFWQMKAEKMSKKSDYFSQDFKELLRGMFEQDPARRMTIKDIKASEWYNKPILSEPGLKFHMGRVCQRMSQK